MDAETSSLKYRSLVHAGSWFQAIPAVLQEQLMARSTLERLAGGQRLFARGDPPDGLYCVIEGAMRITYIAETGQEALLAIVEPPQWFGEIALFDRRNRTHDAWAEGDTVLLQIGQAPLLALLDEYPVYWREFGLLLTQKLRTTFAVLEEAALLPAAGRLARRLVTIAEGYGDWKDRSRRTIRVPQDQLALMLSLSRQTVNQTLKQFESQGMIRLARGGVEVLDLAKLRGLAL